MKKGLSLFCFTFVLTLFFSCQKPVKETLPPAVSAHPSEVTEKKVGVALGGGGARGFAEIGVLRVFEQEKIPICCVSGTSVGSLIGALYCDEGKVTTLEYHAMAIEKDDIFDYNIFSVFSGGLIKGEKLGTFLSNNLRHSLLEDMKVPLVVVATDLRTGEKIGFEKGSVATAVRASCAIPGIFQPVKIGERVYVDGGVSDPIPVDFLKGKDLDAIIAVSISPEIPTFPPENTAEIIRHTASIMFSNISDCNLKEADVLIKPKCGDVRFNDFSKRKELILAGEEAAREKLNEIRLLLE
jgi:NTE family protein